MIANVLKTYGVWAQEYSKNRNKTLVYNKGMISIMQRILSVLKTNHKATKDQKEEESFWLLIGLVINMRKLFSFDAASLKDKYSDETIQKRK